VADTTAFKNGVVLKIDNKLQQIVEFQHVKPGKGPAFVRTKLKDVMTGKVTDKTWNAGAKAELATVDRRDMTYLYNDGTNYVVMDDKTFEQVELSADKFGRAVDFLLENMRIQVSFHENEPLFAELPINVDLKVEHTDPGSITETARTVKESVRAAMCTPIYPTSRAQRRMPTIHAGVMANVSTARAVVLSV